MAADPCSSSGLITLRATAAELRTAYPVAQLWVALAQIAGDPPIMTVVCLGMTTTGPMWQHWITAEALTIGGMWLSLRECCA